MRQLKFLLIMALPALLALTTGSCSSDGGSSPTGNNNPPPGDDFDQTAAIVQSHSSATQAASLVQSMQVIAQGVGQPGRAEGYGWNPDTQQYEWHYEWNQDGYTYVWDYLVQYLDGDGEPQESSAGAAEVIHSHTGTGHYASNQGGADIVYDYAYEYHTRLTGMGTGTLLMTGHGSTAIDYTYTYGDITQDYNYLVSWSTGGEDARAESVSMPEGNGCPTGSIVYVMSPYEMEIVFDGDNSADYMLYDDEGGTIGEGSGTQTLPCSE